MADDNGARRVIGDRFELLERLGGGGMGLVWRARDTELHREVALKEVRPPDPRFSDSPTQEAGVLRERVLREARALARLRHPQVVTIFHIVTAPETDFPWLVMELVPGGSLVDRLDRGLLGPVEAARLGRGVLAGLRAAHAAGILHRDVKPGNVLLREDGSPVLTDFGIAALGELSALTSTGALVGSPEYIAPERVRGQEGNPASDLWSLGLVLYVAVEGRHPLRRDTVLATLGAVLDAPVPEATRAGPLTSVLTALLDRDTDARPDAARLDELLAAVEAGGEAGPRAEEEPNGPGSVVSSGAEVAALPTQPGVAPQPPPGDPEETHAPRPAPAPAAPGYAAATTRSGARPATPSAAEPGTPPEGAEPSGTTGDDTEAPAAGPEKRDGAEPDPDADRKSAPALEPEPTATPEPEPAEPRSAPEPEPEATPAPASKALVRRSVAEPEPAAQESGAAESGSTEGDPATSATAGVGRGAKRPGGDGPEPVTITSSRSRGGRRFVMGLVKTAVALALIVTGLNYTPDLLRKLEGVGAAADAVADAGSGDGDDAEKDDNHLFTPKGVREGLAKLKPLIGGTKVTSMSSHGSHMSASAPRKDDPSLMHSYSYRDGKAENRGPAGLAQGPPRVDFARFDWDMLPGVWRKAQTGLGIKQAKRSHMSLEFSPDHGVVLALYVSDDYGTASMRVNTEGKTVARNPREAPTN
ncbi:serine/threonine protein kinase [Streptomyces sp. AJS327]|uniref:serine/threonine-protein kinase n=1 Tax=Streptomyces sp. AJS327 TaxID=2545265 RepID=UPI0017FAB668|nr:serine/threonine-protein kinase [Streptomyces sp. AJS327]MBA0052077.1 serine/threonine protein kinase [Streptomyces sp. AJS327]